MAAILLAVLQSAERPVPKRSFDFFITPPLVERKVAPGAHLAVELTVFNRSTTPLQLRLGLADLTMTQEGEVRVVSNANPAFSCKTWLTFPDSILRIPGGGRSVFPVDIRTPFGIREGHYAVLTVRTELIPAQNGGIALAGQTGTLFLLQPAMRAKVSAQIRDVTLSSSGGKTLHFGIRVLNDGEVHFRAKGYIIIRNQQNRVVDRVLLNLGTGTVLPLHERIFTGVWNNERKMQPGTYRAVITLQIPGLAKVMQETRDFSL